MAILRHPVLDHGYLELIETWGSDERIVEAARMSTGRGFQGWGPIQKFTCLVHGVVPGTQVCRRDRDLPWVHMNCQGFNVDSEVEVDEKPGDEKLLSYLYKNKHMTPFEMAGATIEIQAPIMVFREWHRHRTQSYNEMSARYTPLPDVNYVPTVERLMVDAGTSNKQAGTTKDARELTTDSAEAFRANLNSQYGRCQREYEVALAAGVPKELARLVLPVGRYSRMRASANLRNWMQFLTLRADSHAQWEIRQYAILLQEMLTEHFRRTMALFNEAHHGGQEKQITS